jgi:hypothetical protein
MARAAKFKFRLKTTENEVAIGVRDYGLGFE